MLLPGLLLALAVSGAPGAYAAGSMESSSTQAAERRMNSIGVVVGSPQWAGIVSDHLSLGLHVGTLGFLNSLGARLLIGSVCDGFRPRFGLGLALVDAVYQEYEDDPEGMAAYGWPTVGFAVRGARFLFAADAGWLFGGRRDAGLGRSGFPAASISFQVRI
jgi:hypothetical protein